MKQNEKKKKTKYERTNERPTERTKTSITKTERVKSEKNKKAFEKIRKKRNTEIQNATKAADLLLQTMPTNVEYNFVKNTPADY